MSTCTAQGPGLKPKHVPMRRCLACRASRPQAELVRLVLHADEWRLDPDRKAPGRGAWICRDKPDCQSAKALKRSLRAQAERVADELKDFREAQLSHASAPAAQEAARSAQSAGPQPKSGRVRVRARTERNNTEKGGPNV